MKLSLVVSIALFGYSFALKDPTEGKSRKQIQQILQNLDALSEDDLVAFGSSNPPACKAIKTDHLARGNPFRYILIDHDCLGGENLQFLSTRINQDKGCAVRAIQRNRDFWCPRIERTNLGMSSEKEKIMRDGGCPGYANNSNSNSAGSNNNSKNGNNNSNNSAGSNSNSKNGNKNPPSPPTAQRPNNGRRPNQRRPPPPPSSSSSDDSRVNLWLVMAIAALIVLIIILAICLVVRHRRRKASKAAATTNKTVPDEGVQVVYSHPHLYPPVPPQMIDDSSAFLQSPPPAYHSLEIQGATLAGPSAPPLTYPITDVDSKN